MKPNSLIKIVIVILLIITKFSFCQSLQDLDIKRGFKDFKIGDSFYKWQNLLEYSSTTNDGSKVYNYTGACCNMVFQYPVQQIKLVFKGSELVRIQVVLKKFQESFEKSGQYTKIRNDDYMSIKNSFELLFGKPTGFDAPQDYNHVTFVWRGSLVSLYSRYVDLGVVNGDQLTIDVISNLYEKQSLNDGF